MSAHQTDGPTRLSRRELGLALAGTAAAAALPAMLAGAPAAAGTGTATGGVVRLGAVGATQTGGLLTSLVNAFEAASGYDVSLTMGEVGDLYTRAGAGELDIVATHLGVPELQEFVGDGAGRWPKLVFSTMLTFVAAQADPAGIRQAADAVDAFSRIAATQSPFVVNNLDNPAFVSHTLWSSAGSPDPAGWFLDTGLQAAAAVQAAAQLGGYTIWGLHPFLMFQQQQPGTGMRAVLFGDSLLQRVIASVVVKPSPTRAVNISGALALERFLTDTSTQGLIRRFRHPAFDQPIFWPAAHHNDTPTASA
jgi:tungstate transport system substrate-binding protein